MHVFEYMWLLFKRWPYFRFQHIVAVKYSDVCGEGTILITKLLNCFKVYADLIPRRKSVSYVGRFYCVWPVPNAEAGK
jgi:hypothetical protein